MISCIKNITHLPQLPPVITHLFNRIPQVENLLFLTLLAQSALAYLGDCVDWKRPPHYTIKQLKHKLLLSHA